MRAALNRDALAGCLQAGQAVLHDHAPELDIAFALRISALLIDGYGKRFVLAVKYSVFWQQAIKLDFLQHFDLASRFIKAG